MNEIYERLNTAISKNKAIILTVKNGLGSEIKELKFYPYILGDDSFQFAFVWGQLQESKLFYKFNLQNIIELKISQEVFNYSNNACYQYALEEEHYNTISGFDNIFILEAQKSHSKEFKSKKFIMTLNAKSIVCYVGATLEKNKISSEKGYIAYGYTNIDEAPTPKTKGKLIIDTLFTSIDEALKQGEKIMKDQIKQSVNKNKIKK
jgi:hypothetical protein